MSERDMTGVNANLPDRMLLIGCGNMGGAMLRGWLSAGIAPGRFTVVDPYIASAPDGVRLLRELPEERFDAILLGIKPQGLADAAPGIARIVGGARVVLSLLAGVELSTLARHFGEAAAIVRIMPNLSAALGKSPVALAGHGVDDGARAMTDALIAPLGTGEWLADEAQFDLVTALVGSGPAFVYRFIDALAQASTGLGLPADQAARLSLAMVEGAALLAAQSEHDPGELARRVASPGGVTQAGLDTLDADNRLLTLITDTLRDARDRGVAMGLAAKQAPDT